MEALLRRAYVHDQLKESRTVKLESDCGRQMR